MAGLPDGARIARVTIPSVSTHLHALIPAAGIGSRVGADLPKQYLPIGARTMLEHAVQALLADARIARVQVVAAPGDTRAAALPALMQPRVAVASVGGESRAASVRAGLDALLTLGAGAQDWVLVHDAARPCVAPTELAALIDALADEPVGALLAVPLADTLKRAVADGPDGARVATTIDRRALWRAATPQAFRIDTLRRALDAPGMLAQATDEASAVEALGLAPRLVACAATNLKVTTADDLPLARAILALQGRLD